MNAPTGIRVRVTQAIIDAPAREDYPVFIPRGAEGTVQGFDPKRRTVTVAFDAVAVGDHIGGYTVDAWEYDVPAGHLEYVSLTSETHA